MCTYFFYFALTDFIYANLIRVKRIHVERILYANWATGVVYFFETRLDSDPTKTMALYIRRKPTSPAVK